MCVQTLLRAAFIFRARPRKTGDTGCSGQREEALLMRENKAQRYTSERRTPCEINHLLGGAPCPKAGKEKVDGLLLCERHALEAKLEGQIECWGGILFHIELWSREASRREREDVVEVLSRETVPLFLQEAPGHSFQGFDVIDVDETSPDLQSSLVLKPTECPCNSLPVGPDHGA